MSFVNRSGGEQRRNEAVPGAPPVDWEPDDPDTVKVHYDVAGWTSEQRAELSAALADGGLPHRWEADEVVVPEAAESHADALFDRLEREIGPFATALAEDTSATEFGLDEWSAGDLDVLRAALVDAEIPHRWEGTTVFVATDAEDVVDDLLDAIERGDIASFDEVDDGHDDAPDGALGSLYSLGDRLARDASDGGARSLLFDLVPRLDARQPPFGVAVRSWATVVDAAGELADAFTADVHDPDVVLERAEHLRTVTRPFV